MSKKVAFTAMEHGTQADYDLIFADEAAGEDGEFARRVLGWLKAMDTPSPYQISRFEHSLQSATRAERDGADDETVVCALLHDIGDIIAPANHSAVAAAVLAPYVSEKNHWIIKHHGIFQGYYFFHHVGMDRNGRDAFRDHPYYQACADFCELYDQNSFDKDYKSEPMSTFVPMIERVMSRPRKSLYKAALQEAG